MSPPSLYNRGMVKVIRPNERDTSTAQTPGMRREAGICAGSAGSEGLWMGTAVNAPGAASGVHHHGQNESGIYILRGRVASVGATTSNTSSIRSPATSSSCRRSKSTWKRTWTSDGEAELLLARNSQEAVVVNVPDPRTAG